MHKLEAIFYSKVRAAVLRLLFGLDAKEMYLSEIESVTHFANRSIEEELRKLQKLDLLTSRRDRSRVYYAANQAHPLYPELRSIVLKTCGLADVVRRALATAPVEYAFIFGSLASGTERAESDLDLMIIGDASHRELATPLRELNDRLGREINPHFLKRDEFFRRLSERDHFLTSVVSKPKLFIIGDEHEFATNVAQLGLGASAQNQP